MPLQLPVVPPPKNGLMPAWVTDYTNAVKLLANATVSYATQPPYGSGAFTFSGSNCVLTLRMNPLPTMDPQNLYNGAITLAKLTGGGANGSMTVSNGVILKAGLVLPT